MSKPKWTPEDQRRFTYPYVSSGATDIRKTFARERKRLKDIEDAQKLADQEAMEKVRKIDGFNYANSA